MPPIIATTAELLSTGVDCKTVKLIVIDKEIESMIMFKQIIGRGTRLFPHYDKNFFTIMDFTGASENFFDLEFDGDSAVELLRRKKICPKSIRMKCITSTASRCQSSMRRSLISANFFLRFCKAVTFVILLMFYFWTLPTHSRAVNNRSEQPQPIQRR